MPFSFLLKISGVPDRQKTTEISKIEGDQSIHFESETGIDFEPHTELVVRYVSWMEITGFVTEQTGKSELERLTDAELLSIYDREQEKI